MSTKPKVVKWTVWGVLWMKKFYPFGLFNDSLGAALWDLNRLFNPFTGYTIEQAEYLGYKKV